MIDALIFDVDGVLIDVTESYRKAIIGTCKAFGKKITNDDINSIKKVPGFNNDWDVTYALAKGTTRVDRNDADYVKMKEKFQSLYLGTDWNGLILNEKKLVKKKTLERLSQKYKLGVVTSRPRAEALFALRDLPFKERFIIAQENCAKEKPAPDGIIELMKRMRTKRAVYIGDTISDALAASGAGIPCIMVNSDNVNDIMEVLV